MSRKKILELLGASRKKKTPKPVLAASSGQAPAPTVRPSSGQAPLPVEKLPIPVKTPKIKNNQLDLGDTGISRYSAFESGVQNVEMIDSTVSNVGALAGGAARVLPAAASSDPQRLDLPSGQGDISDYDNPLLPR